MGFVSNSSSSSFTAIINEETYKNLLDNLKKTNVLSYAVLSTGDITTKKFGKDMMYVYHHYIGNMDEIDKNEMRDFFNEYANNVSAKELAENEINTKNYDDLEPEDCDFVWELRNESRDKLDKEFAKLEKSGECIIIWEDM